MGVFVQKAPDFLKRFQEQKTAGFRMKLRKPAAKHRMRIGFERFFPFRTSAEEPAGGRRYSFETIS